MNESDCYFKIFISKVDGFSNYFHQNTILMYLQCALNGIQVAPSPLVHSTLQMRSKTIKRRLSKVHTTHQFSTLNLFFLQGKKHASNAQRNVSRRVLSSKNSIIPEESYVSQGFDLSIASTGNYSDFQKGLQQGLAAARTARSSVLQKNTSSTLSCLTAGTK